MAAWLAASLALALAQGVENISILVVESFPLPPKVDSGIYQPSFDARATALSAGSRPIYEAIGLWDRLEPGLCAIDSIHVSTRGRLGSTLMNASSEALPALGYVVENQWLGRQLLSRMPSFPQVEWCSPATVRGLSLESGAQRLVELSLDGVAHRVACELLVIADGAGSSLARSMGIEYSEADYRHSAIIANVSTARQHNGRAFERFTDQGPVALLPLLPAEGLSRSALVWTLPTALAEIIMQLRDEAFLVQLQERFGFRLGAFSRVGQRHAYPLRLVEAAEQCRTGVVIMGNAAHSLHPVAGQGFNLALRDVARLVEVLVSARSKGQGFGDLSVLQSYRELQLWDQRKTTLFSDRVSDLFAMSQPLVAVARDIGLSALDVVSPAKSWFVRQAAGLGSSKARW